MAVYKCKRCNEFIKADDKVKTKGAFRSYCKCGWVEYTAPYDLWEKVEPEGSGMRDKALTWLEELCIYGVTHGTFKNLESEMMHKHSGCCKHEDKDMRFCQECHKPYCEACGKEWDDKCELSHGYPWASGIPYDTIYHAAPTVPYYGTTCNQEWSDG